MRRRERDKKVEREREREKKKEGKKRSLIDLQTHVSTNGVAHQNKVLVRKRAEEVNFVDDLVCQREPSLILWQP